MARHVKSQAIVGQTQALLKNASTRHAVCVGGSYWTYGSEFEARGSAATHGGVYGLLVTIGSDHDFEVVHDYGIVPKKEPTEAAEG